YFSAFCAMKRGSRAYGALVIGSTMLQISDSVGSFMNGSITAVSVSGTTSMSLLWIGIQPRIDEPSNPRPSSNTPSVSSASGMVKCCHRPRKSMNFRSTITAFLSCAYPITSFAFGMLVGLLVAAAWPRVVFPTRLQRADPDPEPRDSLCSGLLEGPATSDEFVGWISGNDVLVRIGLERRS